MSSFDLFIHVEEVYDDEDYFLMLEAALKDFYEERED